jgi:hypothetical protein
MNYYNSISERMAHCSGVDIKSLFKNPIFFVKAIDDYLLSLLINLICIPCRRKKFKEDIIF